MTIVDLCHAETFVPAFCGWLQDSADDLAPFRHASPGSFVDSYEHERRLRRLLFRDGWTRWGWPEDCGGLGGDPLLRGLLYEELSNAGYILPESFGLVEIIAPTLLRFAPHLASSCMPAMLSGEEMWCQGFSEPEAGSDLASLRTRAVPDGDSFVLTGQKVWTSRAQVARRCLVLARTGSPESRHRGLSMFWLDLTSPGVIVQPIPCADGRDSFCELFLDDVRVPAESLVGALDGGWTVAMYLLQFERGNYAWLRQAWLASRLESALRQVAPPAAAAQAGAVGEAYLQVLALRATCRETLLRLGRGESPGPVISVDKLLLSRAEKAVLDTARQLLWPSFEIGDDSEAAVWRREWWFSRVTSVLGGCAEVQHDILADRVLGLPKG